MSAPKGKSGILNVSLKNVSSLRERLNNIDKASERAIKSTVKDFKTRAPAWISKAVTEQYGIKKSEVKDSISGTSKIGSIQISGTQVDNIGIKYSGRLLTPTHFKMRPTAPPAKRSISAEIIRGKRAPLSSQAFLGSNKGGGFIPFQRVGDERYPIKSIKTLSVPQMITNETVRFRIRELIDEGLLKRLDHHVEREMKKL